MANLQLYGPVMWVHSPGQNGLLPGEEHNWFAADFFPGNPAVFQVTAHPFGDFVVAELAVINFTCLSVNLWAARDQFYGPQRRFCGG